MAPKQTIETVSEQEFKQEFARRHHIDFMRYCWSKPTPMLSGIHTKMVCARLDRAFQDFRNGKSTYLLITIPYRHGKSDIVSRYLPSHFIGEFPDEEIMVASYNSDLVKSFSRFARDRIQSEEYQNCYPSVHLSKEERAVESWGIIKEDENEEERQAGHVYWTGIGGTMTGKGFSLGVIDDPFKNRQEAESETIRNTVWDGFRHDFMTRAAPVHIVIIMGTAWHVDDLFGRIRKEMTANPEFPQFDELVFPAFDEGHPVYVGGREIRYENGVLFPERFNLDWYKMEKASAGPYGYASMLQGRPTVRGGKIIKTDKVKFYEEAPEGLFWTRGWDLASSEKQRTSEDPDWTAGIKMAVRWLPTADPKIHVPILYIDDMVDGRKEAPERDQMIVNTAIGDGMIPVGIEAFGAYKDAYSTISKTLRGVCTVRKIQLAGDKMSKWSVLEAPFASGNVFMKRAEWNARLLKQLGEVPAAAHDDYVDALTVSFSMHEPHFNKVIRNFSPNHPELVKEFKLNWNKAIVPPKICLHYASVSMTPDMYLHIVCGIWDDITGHLYIYHAETVENISPELIVPGLIQIMNLENFYFEGFLASKNMLSDNKSLVRVLNQSFEKRLPHQSIRLREPRRYDLAGSVAITNEMVNQHRLVLHIKCNELAASINQWTIEGGKVNASGQIEALMMLVSELDTRQVIKKNLVLAGYKYDKEAFFGF